MMSQEKILIIDGNSLMHRAFHAITFLSTSTGIATNAVYGFTNMLNNLLETTTPQYVAVAFDKGKITFRNQLYSEYKAHRKKTPADLVTQFALLKEVLIGFRIKYLELENYEADDIIGTLAHMATKQNLATIILTGDRDTLQLVSPQVQVMITQKGVSEVQIYDEEQIWQRYGVKPKQLQDVKGLMGDSSDNIPGVPGIGEKTALKLIQEYGSLDEVLEVMEQLPPRWRNKLNQHQDLALLSKKLAIIDCQVPLNIKLEELIWPGPDYPSLLATYNKLEFKTLINNIMENLPQQLTDADTNLINELNLPQNQAPDVKTLTTATDLEHFLTTAKQIGTVTLHLEGTKQIGINAAYCMVDDELVYVLPTQNDAPALKTLGIICSDPNIKKYCFDGKEMSWLLGYHGLQLQGLHFDITLATYLLNPGSPPNSLAELAMQYLNVVLPQQQENNWPAAVSAIKQISAILQQKLTQTAMDKLYYQLELPLVTVLADMEMTGVAIEPALLQQMAKETQEQIQDLTQQIYDMAGEKFNINSPKQLGVILFEKLGLPVIKRTKTGYSTDAGVLEQLAPQHPLIDYILAYRQIAKLKSTYIDGLFKLINPNTGKIHTTFHQNITATGRLSSSDPNLQNIPIRLEQGRKIRKCFVPHQPQNIILAADYSQIELRILAHMSGDPNLTEAFQKGQDIHTRTAAEVFSLPMEQVTPELRNRAKAVNFGIIYGLSDFGLARDIKVSLTEAAQYIESYFNRYSGVKDFIQTKIDEATAQGYATTILNRRRYLPDLKSKNRAIRGFGERTAVNTPIQGSAADIIKLAMVSIDKEIKNRQLQTKMILQVHDELIFDVPKSELPEVQILVQTHMENVLPLQVPLVVDIKIGPNWYDVRKV